MQPNRMPPPSSSWHPPKSNATPPPAHLRIHPTKPPPASCCTFQALKLVHVKRTPSYMRSVLSRSVSQRLTAFRAEMPTLHHFHKVSNKPMLCLQASLQSQRSPASTETSLLFFNPKLDRGTVDLCMSGGSPQEGASSGSAWRLCVWSWPRSGGCRRPASRCACSRTCAATARTASRCARSPRRTPARQSTPRWTRCRPGWRPGCLTRSACEWGIFFIFI